MGSNFTLLPAWAGFERIMSSATPMRDCQHWKAVLAGLAKTEGNRMNRYAFVQGHLRQVRPCWAWLFRLLGIGVELPDEDTALREVMEAMERYHRACEVYLRA